MHSEYKFFQAICNLSLHIIENIDFFNNCFKIIFVDWFLMDCKNIYTNNIKIKLK